MMCMYMRSLAGLDWVLRVYPGGREPDEVDMVILFFAPAPGSRDRERRVFVTMRMLRSNVGAPLTRASREHTWRSGSYSTDSLKTNIMSRSRLLIELGEYGTAIFQVELKLFPPPEHRVLTSPDTHVIRRREGQDTALAAYGSLLESGVHSDVALQCGDYEIPAHKAILAARSPVFKAMFEHKMAETEEGVVKLDDIELEVLREFLRFLYTGDYTSGLGLPAPSAAETSTTGKADGDLECRLYPLAHRFQVSSLQSLLEESLCAKPMTTGRFWERFTLAETYDMQKLKTACLDFLRDNPERVSAVMATEAFEGVSKGMLASVLTDITQKPRDPTAAPGSEQQSKKESDEGAARPARKRRRQSRSTSTCGLSGDDVGPVIIFLIALAIFACTVLHQYR